MLPDLPPLALEGVRLQVHDGSLASVSVCVSCGSIQSGELPACASCSASHFQRVPFLGDQAVPPEIATPLGRALGCDPRVLMLFPSPLLRTALHVLTLWAGCLASVSGKMSRGAAFSPPMIQGKVICLWIVAAPRWGVVPQLGPVPHLPLHEFLQVDDALSECAFMPLPGGVPCSTCHRPRAVTGLLYHMPAGSSPKQAVSGFCPKIQSEHITRALAGTCFGYRGSARIDGVVVTSARRRHDCGLAAHPPEFPAPLLPLDVDPYLVVSSPLVTGGAELVQQGVCCVDSLSELTLLSMNCGGAARKATDIIATLTDLSVDIAFLQELWEGFDVCELEGMGYRVFYDGVAERGAGMAILVAYALLPQPPAGLQDRGPELVQSFEDLQILTLTRPGGHRIIGCNVYRRPRQAADVWEVIQVRVAEARRTVNDLFFVAGDLNETLRPGAGSKVSKCMRPGHCWAYLHIPYPSGEPTNFQPVGAGKVARTEIDYILVDVLSPVSLMAKAVYPGVSHHGAFCCQFTIPPHFSYNKNVSDKRLNFRKASPASIAQLAAHASLLFWYYAVLDLSVDDCMAQYFPLALQFIPRYIGRVQSDDSSRPRDMEYRAMQGEKCAGECVQKWRQQARDRVCQAGLAVEAKPSQLASVNAVSSRLYKLKKKSFSVVTRVSPDGVYFPSEPGAFIDEARTQAQELYGLRALANDVHMIRDEASRARALSRPRDDLSMCDFFLELLCSLGEPLASSLVGSVSVASTLSFREWEWVLSKHGSEATALDELPECLLQALGASGHWAVLDWVRRLRQGHFSKYLQSALHICLLKKDPQWLIRNSRPIVIGPVLRRRESTLLFAKFMSRSELTGLMPPWAYAYRKEVTPHDLGLFLRWFLAYWAVKSPSGCWCADWDESNAFCNVNRDALRGYLMDDPSLEHVGVLTKWFFDGLMVYLQTPYGLAPPYYMQQGGIQGDNMGVGGYLIPRILRSWALLDCVAGPPHPCLPGVQVPEVIFSDDGRQMALSPQEMVHNLAESYRLASVSGGTVNASKLKMYHIFPCPRQAALWERVHSVRPRAAGLPAQWAQDGGHTLCHG